MLAASGGVAAGSTSWPGTRGTATKPTGPYNRVSDNRLAKRLLGWEPRVNFDEGLDRSIKWYYATHDKKEVMKDFERTLMER